MHSSTAAQQHRQQHSSRVYSSIYVLSRYMMLGISLQQCTTAVHTCSRHLSVAPASTLIGATALSGSKCNAHTSVELRDPGSELRLRGSRTNERRRQYVQYIHTIYICIIYVVVYNNIYNIYVVVYTPK